MAGCKLENSVVIINEKCIDLLKREVKFEYSKYSNLTTTTTAPTVNNKVRKETVRKKMLNPRPPADESTLLAVVQLLRKYNLKGTEELLRKEANICNRLSITTDSSAYKSEGDPEVYEDVYNELKKFVEGSLDIYKHELGMILYPVLGKSCRMCSSCRYVRAFPAIVATKWENVNLQHPQHCYDIETITHYIQKMSIDELAERVKAAEAKHEKYKTKVNDLTKELKICQEKSIRLEKEVADCKCTENELKALLEEHQNRESLILINKTESEAQIRRG